MIVDRVLQLYRSGGVTADVAQELLPYPLETYNLDLSEPPQEDRGIKRRNSQMSEASNASVPCLRYSGSL